MPCGPEEKIEIIRHTTPGILAEQPKPSTIDLYKKMAKDWDKLFAQRPSNSRDAARGS